MSVRIASQEVLAERGVEYVVLEDSLGRKLHLCIQIIAGPDPDRFIQEQIDAFAEQEAAIQAHIEKRKASGNS